MSSEQTRELVRIASRIVAGAGVYVAIVVLATPLPPAAGLMLTFPALNGLGFFFSEDARAASIARTMFWMPVVNGALCAGYILLFLLLARISPPTLVGWCLLGLVTGVWVVCVSRKRVREGIDRDNQFRYAVAVTLVGAVLVAAGVFAPVGQEVASRAIQAPDGNGLGWIAEAIWRSRLKIGLFTLALTILVLSIVYLPLSDSTRGILSGLPIVPFGGLVAVAGDMGTSADERTQIFRGMVSSVWLGPAVAVWFIYCFSRYLSGRKMLRVQRADTALRFSALLLGWLLTFVITVVVAYTINSLSRQKRDAWNMPGLCCAVALAKCVKPHRL